MNKQIKYLYFFLVLVICNSDAFGQTKWMNREDSLYTIWRLEDLSCPGNPNSYLKFIEESGSVGYGVNAWFKERKMINDSLLKYLNIPRGKNLTLFIPDNFDSLTNARGSMNVYLLNFSNKTLFIPRIDATLDSISEFIKVDNKWLQITKNKTSTCGNSYYKQKLEPSESNLFEVDYINQKTGTEVLRYKLVFNYYGKKIESNEIQIKLFPNQLKRFLEEGMRKRH